MMAYSMRYFRIVFWPVVVLEITMIVSTMPEGGHHLVDLIAGAAVAGGSIVVVRSAAYRTSPAIQSANSPQRPIPMGRS